MAAEIRFEGTISILHSVRSRPPVVREAPTTEYVLPAELRDRHAALVVAHPGHELRVHGWMELARPVVFVLTDGSGHTRKSRLASTTEVLTKSLAKPGPIYGRFADVDVYAAILEKDVHFFIELAEELAHILVSSEIDYVVGDRIEGYNPTHDICRSVINAAVELAQPDARHPIATFDFPIMGEPDRSSEADQDGQLSVHLDQNAMDRKLSAANSYLELSGHVSTMIKEFGTELIRLENLRPVRSSEAHLGFQTPPFYEEYGERQVAAGVYDRVIGYRDHMLPLFTALLEHARR
ncbi:MAG: hypothetical protein ABI923_12410 [bacterium]